MTPSQRERRPRRLSTVDCAKMLHVIGQPTRLQLIQRLSKRTACVLELARAVGARPARISHHLAILRAAQIVAPIREGKRVRYALTPHFVRCIELKPRSGPALDFPCLGMMRLA